MPSALDLLLAGLPIITLIVLLVLRVRPVFGALGAIAAILLLWFRFPISGGELGAMTVSLTEAIVNIVCILLGALVLSVFAADSHAQDTMSEWFETVAHHRDRAILMYGIALTPFLESAIGWGVSVIVAVPLLLRAGLSPTRAVLVGVLGLVVCPWGSLGPGLIVTAELGQLSIFALGTATALYSLPVIIVMGVAIAVIGVGKRMTVGLATELAVASLVLWGVLVVVNWALAPALGGLLAGLATLVVFLVFARLRGAQIRMTAREVRAFAPFIVLLVAMLAMVAVTSLVDTGGWEPVLTSPGLWMMVSAAAAPFFYGMAQRDVAVSLRRGLANWVPVTITTLLFVIFGALLAVSGMSSLLAEGAAANDTVFLIALPFIGGLAGYLTTSNTVVGTMLTIGVTDAAIAIGGDPAMAAGVQTASAGAAIPAAPSRIVLAIGAANQIEGAGDRVNYGAVALVTVSAALVIASLLVLTLFVFPF